MPELRDLYDRDRNPLGKTIVRDVDPIPEGCWTLGVKVWIRDDCGRFLLGRRHPNKLSHPLYWEPVGGGVQAGEDTRSAAVREVGEELGISLDAGRLIRMNTLVRCEKAEFIDVYLARWNGKIESCTPQADEVVDVCWAEYDDLAKLEAQGIFEEEYREPFAHLKHLPAALCTMEISDYPEAASLWKTIPGMGLNDVDDSAEGIAKFLNRNPGLSCIVRMEDGIVGTILAGYDGRRGYLYHAAVRPDLQGKGIGTALAESALEHLRKAGASKVGLMVFADNQAGCRFWSRFGFNDRSDVSYRSYPLI